MSGVSIFSDTWCYMNIYFILFLSSSLFILKQFNLESRYFKRSLAIVMLFFVIFMDIQKIRDGSYTIEHHLHLHLCNMMYFVSIILLFRFNQILYDVLFVCGIIGGIISFLVPDLHDSISFLYLFSYFIRHFLIIFVPLYFYYICNKELSKNIRKKVAKIFFLCITPFVALCNKLLISYNANYLFINKMPNVDLPFLNLPWPLHFVLISFIFYSLTFIPNICIYVFYRTINYLPISKVRSFTSRCLIKYDT